ncbi:hypothetical protein FRB95_005059 [Tulasnella sp. JGI-2019a]|nr:hypothetical protein FRB93_001399 [Tulasnella sp. JGI-2019a]KAG9029623.1 hypothetical protein FRB95_005059 [Tulasnella sp. JGI-2019a]
MSQDSANQVTSFNNAIAETNSGKTDVDDFTFNYWYKSNWGDMLVPAPMAVSILGQLTLVATAADFKLVSPSGGFKQVQYPDSFRATILQLTDDGARSLQQSYSNMDVISKRCAGIKPGLNNIIQLLVGTDGNTEKQNNDDIKRYLPSQLSQLQTAVQSCLTKAQEMDTDFAQLLDLTMEIHESCTATQGDNESKLKDATMRQSILDAQKKAAEEAKTLEKEHLEEAKKSFTDAQDQFKKAADSMPSGWDLVGMQFVEGLSKAVLTGVNAGINKFAGQSQQQTAGQNNAISTAQGNQANHGKRATMNPPTSYDPAYQKAECLRISANSLHHIATGGPDGGVDWSIVEGSGNNGLGWTKGQMETALGTNFGTDQPSITAKKLLTDGAKLCVELDALKASKPADKVAAVVSKINSFSYDASSFATEAQLKTNTPAMTSPGFDTPAQPPVDSNDGAASMAVKNAQFRLSSAGTQLSASRDSYEKSTSKMLEVTKALGEIMGQIAGLNLQKIEWDKIRTILLQAIAFLCQLKGCIADLVHFFSAVNNTIKVSMGTTLSSFITLISDSTKDVSLAGVSLSNFGKQAIYNQALAAAKIGRLVQNISQLYVTMYDQHIQEGVKMLLGMSSIVAEGSQQAVIAANGRKLSTWAAGATNGIKDLLQGEQSKFESDVNARVEEMQKSIAGILPKPAAQVTKAIESATAAHVEDVRKLLDDTTAAKPVYNTSKLKRLSI